MNRSRVIAVFGVLALSAACSTCAHAQSCDGGWGGGWGGGWPYLANPNQLDYIPYFAAHPPVYYSVPVPRTYGYSPYAYPPGTRTPDVELGPESEVMVNPFVPQEGANEEVPSAQPMKMDLRHSASRVRRVQNRFVSSGAK